MSNMYTHEISDHHVTRCRHDHDHGKKLSADMNMHFELPSTPLQEMTLEQRLKMLLADLKQSAEGKTRFGFGMGGTASPEAGGDDKGSSAVFMPLSETGAGQEIVRKSVAHHDTVVLLQTSSGEHRRRVFRSGFGMRGDSLIARAETALSGNKSDDHSRNTCASSGKAGKRLSAGWIASDETIADVDELPEKEDLPVTPSESPMSGCYNASGCLDVMTHTNKSQGSRMDQRA